MIKKISLLFLLASFILLSGCQTAAGVGKGMASTAEGVGKDTCSLAQAIGAADSWIRKNLW